MITQQQLLGEYCCIRQIEMQDCTETYLEWLSDPEVNEFLETRWIDQSMETILAFVDSQRSNTHSFLFAIIYNIDQRHIGNIKIGPINHIHHHADISYFIGEKTLWGKGIATEAIGLVCKFGFEELGLHRIEAGVYSKAKGSYRALEKNGFIREGVFREQVVCGTEYTDVYRYGMLKKEYLALGANAVS